MGKLAQKALSSAKKILDQTGISGCDYCEKRLKEIRACAVNKHIFKGTENVESITEREDLSPTTT